MKTHTLRGGRCYEGPGTYFVKLVTLDKHIAEDGGDLEKAQWHAGFGDGEQLRVPCNDGVIWRQRCEVSIGDVVKVGKWRLFKRRTRYVVKAVKVVGYSGWDEVCRERVAKQWRWVIELEEVGGK